MFDRCFYLAASIMVLSKLAYVELIFRLLQTDKKKMRAVFKKIRFLLFPLMSLGLISMFTFYTMGFIKIGPQKNEKNVLEKIGEIQRHVASINKEIDRLGKSDEPESEDSKTLNEPKKTLSKSNPILAEMQMEQGSTVSSLIQTTCDFESFEKSVSSSQIKFDFMDCGISGHQLKLFNKTNGYEAQIFGLRGNKVSSDFIQLELGVNELIFQISSTPGQIKSQIIKIQRIH